MSANQSDMALLVSSQKQSSNERGNHDANREQIQQIEGTESQTQSQEDSSFDSQLHKNLNSLDEVMFHSSSVNKPRSTSINVNLVEGLRDHDKNSSDDALRLSKPSTFEGMLELQESVNCFPEGLSSFLLNSQKNGAPVENDKVEDISANQEAIPSKDQQKTISEEINSNFLDKRKHKLPMILLPSSKISTTHYRGNLGHPIMDNSPIKEIQSDNSSYRENFTQPQPVHVTTSTRSGYDNVEALQNDEFTLMFQSNCPIKSPTLPRIKKKHIEHPSQPGSLSSPMKDSLDKLKDSTGAVAQGLIDSSQTSSKVNNTPPQIQSLAGISQEELQKNEEDPIEEQVLDLKTIEREAIPINKDAVQYGLTDIRSVRNYKVNAFRNKLNLQSQQQQLTMNQQEHMNVSGSQKNIPLMSPPVSLMEMQKNQNYNTVETPIGGVGQRTMQRPRLSVPPLMHLGRNISVQEGQKEQKEFNPPIHEEGQNCAEVDGSSSKRKFQRQLLRIKVDPENSYNKREENTETWDEVVSSDQGPTETILEPKARQGSSNFEDQYTIINERPLGEGTSGCVYQCVKKSDDDTIYAVKVMRNVDEEMSKSIFQTFGIQYRLQNESVSRVYEVYYNENSQTVHFVMEYIPFRSLDSLLRDKKRTLKETDSSQIVLKLLKAVCYMEQRGVCHRDLKPENILISEDLTQIKIIDFGISKSFVKSQRVQHITQYFKHKMYTPTGTPSYKAPEILQGAGYTQLIDMWDVGVITYQLICKGKHPFKCATQAEQDQRILTQNYDQTDECWINASSNAKNFVKQLLRLNRYPAFEALKHPWIEQRKIDVSDDDNRNAAKLEKKPTNDTMTISVPVHFQPRLFNTFNITATNSEQSLRSSIAENNNQAQNQVNSSNDFDGPSGNTNAIIRSKQNQDESSSCSARESGTPEPLRKSNFGNQNNEVALKKKHSIQSFSSTQDVVHVVMRQKLSESREKMMQFFLKANSIIKNLEEEQLKLEQNSLPGKTHKRTHSAEKQSEQPNNGSNTQGNLAVPNLAIEDLSLLSSGGLFGSSSKINTPLVHPNSSMSQEDIQRGRNSQSGTPGAGGPGMQTSFHMSLFSKEAQSSFLSNKNGSQKQIPINFNNNGNNQLQLNNSNTQSEGDRCYNSQQHIHQVPDFNSMKFSSLLPRKSSQQQQSQHAHANNNRKSKLIQRRNSSQQTNSMEMSINFTKEVIGELQQTFDNDESLKGEGTPSRNMRIADYENILKSNQSNNTSQGSIEERTKVRGSQPSLFFPKQQLQGQKNKRKGKGKKALEELMKAQKLANIPGQEGFNEKDEEKWKLIAENMEKSNSQDDDDEDDDDSSNSNSSSSSSSSSSDSSEDRTESFDLDKFLTKQPAPGEQRFSNEEEELAALNPQPGQNQQNEQAYQHSQMFENNLKESLSNFPQCFNKDQQSQSKPCSIVISDAKNMGKISSGIFQSTPYVNYMSSSKDNFINKSLIELQGQKDDRHQSSAVVMITSSASSKENSHHHHQNHSAELPMQQQNQHASHIQHSNSLAHIKQHHHHHPHHTKHHSKKNHKNTKINPQKNTLNAILPSGGSTQCNNHCKNNNQSMTSNCSSCGLPNYMQQLQEQKSQDGGGGNEEKLFRNKLAPIPKRCSNEMSFNDSMGDQNLSFIDMNQSKLVQSFYPNSEDQIPINHSVKKNNFLFSMNVSQTSSITAGNISLSNSGNNNTIRSFHAPNSGIVGSGLNSNGHGENAGTKERGNNNANASKFKWQQSEQNSSGGSNSILKKGGKMEIDMSVSQQISQGEIPLQMSQKPFLDNSVLNSSYDATPSKHAQQQQEQQASNIGNADPDQNNNSQSDNSNNSKTSLPIAVGESKPVSQGSLSSLSSPQKRKPSGSQSGSGEVQNQQPPQSKENSLNSNEEESNKCLENAIKIIEPTQENEKNKRSRSKSPGNASPVGLRQSGYRGTFFQHLNQQASNYSTIIEESGETRSYLNSSLAASSKQEFDGTTSMGLRFNQTRSLTQINQSILERYESNAQSLSINYNPSIISHQNSVVGHNQTIRSCEDSDFPIDDRQLSNSNDLNNSPFRRQISSSGKKLAGGINKSKHSGNQLPNSFKGSGPNSKTHSPKIERPQISQHSFDEFFGTMQKSAFFEEDLQQATTVPQESHHHNFQNAPLTSIQEKEQEIFPQERHYSDITSLTEQPPLLKHRKSSLKGAHSKDNFFDAIADILKQTPELSSLQPPSTTNNEKTFHAAK